MESKIIAMAGKEVVETAEGGDTKTAVELFGEARYRIMDALVEQDGYSFIAIGRPEAAGAWKDNGKEAIMGEGDALRKGLDFEKIGNMFLRSYHKNSAVEAVKLIFLTMDDFPYRELESQVKKAEQITRAIDHILKDIAMNCQFCSLKQICNEVEGMRELQFGAVQAL